MRAIESISVAINSEVLGLLLKICLLCHKKKKDCKQDFDKNIFLLPLLRIKDEILMLSQKTENKDLDMLFLNRLANLLDMELLKL